MYNVYAWRNTGYNLVNLPDSPARLLLNHAHQFPAIDYVQQSLLTSITIRANYEEAIGIDYIAVMEDNGVYPDNATFYIVNSITMTSKDVAVLSVSEDFITTAGGLESIWFNGGMIIRRSIEDSEDVFGAFTLPDEYMQLNEEPNIIIQAYTLQQLTATDTGYHIIDSTVKLDDSASEYTTVVDQTTGRQVQSTGTLPPVSSTKYHIGGSQSGGQPHSGKEVPNSTASACYMNVEMYSIQNEALAKLRGRGLENAIVASYYLPKGAVKSYESASSPGSSESSSRLSDITGHFHKSTSGLQLTQGLNSFVFKRCYMGDTNRVGILTASGSRLENKPEEIYELSGELGSPLMAKVIVVTDPRSTGRPYFAFSRYHNLDLFGSGIASDLPNFFAHCVEGAQWRQVPLVWRGASGSDIIKQKYNLSAVTREAGFNAAMSGALADRSIAKAQADYYGMTMGDYFGEGNGLGRMLFGNHNDAPAVQTLRTLQASSMGQLISNPVATLGFAPAQNLAQLDTAQAQTLANLGSIKANQYVTNLEAQQSAQRNEELYSLGVQLNNVTPQIGFGGDDNTIRDVLDDGIIMYQYRPTANDMYRMNAILARFGHKTYEPLVAYDNQYNPATSDLVSGSNYTYKQPDQSFDYLQVSGAQVSATDKRQGIAERAGISAQLSGGIRFWHSDVAQWTDPTLL